MIYSTKSLEVLAFPLNHKIETYGYMFREKTPQLNIRKEALEKYGFTKTEIGTLKRGEDVLRPAGIDEGVTFLNGFISEDKWLHDKAGPCPSPTRGVQETEPYRCNMHNFSADKEDRSPPRCVSAEAHLYRTFSRSH